MSLRINWTSESEKTFSQNLEYLSKEWNNVVINHFLDRVEEVLEKIKSSPRLYPQYRSADNIYKCVVHERIILYYKLKEEEGVIDLLTFWNTYQDPNKLKL